MINHVWMIGGGNCSLCKSPDTNMINCPLNPRAIHPSYEKHSLARNIALKKVVVAPTSKETKKALKQQSLKVQIPFRQPTQGPIQGQTQQKVEKKIPKAEEENISYTRRNKSIYGKACNDRDETLIRKIALSVGIPYQNVETACALLDKYVGTFDTNQKTKCKDNISYLTQEHFSEMHPIDLVAYEEEGIVNCFTVEELLEMQKHDETLNPYTKKVIPERVFKEAMIRQFFIEQVEEQAIKPLTTSQKINSALTNKFNYGGNFSKVLNMTREQQDILTRQYPYDTFASDRLRLLAPRRKERLLYILETIPVESTSTTNTYLDEISRDNEGRHEIDEGRREVDENLTEELKRLLLGVDGRWGRVYDWRAIIRLIENGADINAEMGLPLRIASEGELDVVKYLIENGADIHANEDGALLRASMFGKLDIVIYLVENGADAHGYNDRALESARNNGHLDIVDYLLTQV